MDIFLKFYLHQSPDYGKIKRKRLGGNILERQVLKDNIVNTFIYFESLESVSSRNEKLDILRGNSENPVLRELLVMTYDPSKIYHMKKLPEPNQSIMRSYEENYYMFLHLLESLNKGVLSGNDAWFATEEFFSGCTGTEMKWYSRVLRKDLNVGIQAKTINEAIPDLIPTFSPMLAKPIKRYPERFIVEPKYDGMRILGFTTNGLLFSRKGKAVNGFDSLSEELKKLPPGLVIDGEIMVGKFNDTMTQAFRKSTGKRGYLHAFDLITEEAFRRGELRVPFSERRSNLISIIEDYNTEYILKVPS